MNITGWVSLNCSIFIQRDSTDLGAKYFVTKTSNKFNKSTSGKLWIEYVPNFKSDDFSYYTTEASLTVTMTNTLSLKTAYNLFHREIGDKKDTITFTTALVAKY